MNNQKVRDLTTVTVGGTITIRRGEELWVHRVEGSSCSITLDDPVTVPVVDLITMSDFDDAGLVMDGQLYPRGDRQTVFYRINVYAPVTGELVGYANVSPFNTSQYRTEGVHWLHDDKDLLNAARLAMRRGQRELIFALLKESRRASVEKRWSIRRRIRAERLESQNVVQLHGTETDHE